MARREQDPRRAAKAAPPSSRFRISYKNAAIVLAVVAAVALVAGVSYRWLSTPAGDSVTDRPGEMDISPKVASAKKDPVVAKAMAMIEGHLANKSPNDWNKEAARLHQAWSDPDRQWIVLHQLKAFGRTDQRIAFVLRGVKFDDRGRPFVRPGWEGHPGQVAIALLRSGVGIDEKLTVEGKQFTVRDMIRTIKDKEDHESIGKHDPAYYIEGLALIVRPGETWTSENGVRTSLMHYVTLGFRRLPMRSVSGTFACGGLHYSYGIGVALRQAEARTDLDDTDRDYLKRLQLLVNQVRKDWLQDVLPEYTTLAKSCVKKFRDKPSEQAALEVRSAFTGLGHILELALDKRSAFQASMPPEMIQDAVKALAGLTEEWLDPENAQLRDDVGRFALQGGVLPMGSILIGDMCHCYRALLLYSEDPEQKR